jgi:Fe-S cluster biogenesis protein NfuA/nitrite reductase/ring-hydroxylating ferredoxin subunit
MTTTEHRRTPDAAASDEPGFEELARRVDDAVARLAELSGPAREVAEEVKAAVEAVHRTGLVTIVRRLRADEHTRPVLFELVDDPVVHLLLSLHGIVRPDPMTQARQVLDTVRPRLQSHGGDAELVRIEDGVAYVRLQGACTGCSMSAVTLRTGVEEALVAGVAAVRSVEVLPAEPAPTLIPLSEIRVGPPPDRAPADAPAPAEHGWVRTRPVDEIPDGRITPMSLVSAAGQQSETIVVNLDGRLTAYVNACAHEGLPLDAALLDTTAGTLTCPWHGFCYDAADGECMSAPGARLEQLPLRVDDAYVWVRVPG